MEAQVVRHRLQEAVLAGAKQEKQFGVHQPGKKAGLPVCLLRVPRPHGKKKNLKVLLKVEGKSTKYMASLPLWGTLASCWRHFVVSALSHFIF